MKFNYGYFMGQPMHIQYMLSVDKILAWDLCGNVLA